MALKLHVVEGSDYASILGIKCSYIHVTCKSNIPSRLCFFFFFGVSGLMAMVGLDCFADFGFPIM